MLYVLLLPIPFECRVLWYPSTLFPFRSPYLRADLHRVESTRRGNVEGVSVGFDKFHITGGWFPSSASSVLIEYTLQRMLVS